ncbi:hypothetical protein [Pedobacter cryoconitis]|uniref:PLAT domain-containing protein n=1 Tax=Pedobacter cryoconitis TaxID=188932 RepID=A0A7X0J0J1_9SPHI|nr:hypothetical protein [Pedobacter cryoconitis]MBB6498690.1 hypothetical protein [Pedobacter cryoconitis]
MKLFTLSATARGKTGKIIAVSYSLKKSAGVSLSDNGFNIGYTNINLDQDQSTDPNIFSTKGKQKYLCLMEEEGLQVTLYANGMSGDYWTLDILVDGVPLNEGTIKVYTDTKGHLDYDKLIK